MYSERFYFKDGNFKLIYNDTFDILKQFDEKSFDMIFADPPYFLSSNGITCSGGNVMFMRKTGIFDLLENHLISNVFDYVTGVEVGMDTNGRKGRTGDAMEDLVESYLLKSGFVRDFNYFKEYTKTDIMSKWGVDLSHIEQKLKGNSQNKNAEKRFDFVVKTDKMLYVIETNFYAVQGSKLNETARSYKMIETEFKNMKDVTFVWITDGKGWKSARHNLEETFNEMDNIYNINDMKNGIMTEIFK